MSLENREIVREFYRQVVNGGNLGMLANFLSPDYIEHYNPAASGHEGFTHFFLQLSSAFPDLRISIDDLISEGDKVAARVTVRATHQGVFMGSLQPTGRKVVFSGIDIFQLRAGKITARWNLRDIFGLVQQLGVSRLPG